MVNAGTIGLAILGWLLMWWLARTARIRRHNPQRWQSALALLWALIWIAHHFATEAPLKAFFQQYSLSSQNLAAIAIILCLVVYGVLYAWMMNTHPPQRLLDKIVDIGRRDEHKE